MTAARPLLRMNQGDRSEVRTYYCMHFVAEELGFFASEGVDVAFLWAETGGGTIRGGQLPAVIDGTADLAIGGPMVLMRMVEEGGPSLVAFCAAVAANPWVLAASAPQPGFRLADLRGSRVRDIAGIGTATLTFRWLLRQHGLDDVLEPSCGNEATDLDEVASGQVPYCLHSLHALAPMISADGVAVVAELAGPTGAVPWSAYIAQAERLRAQPHAYAAFARAIGRALAWMAAAAPAEIAAVVARHYPGYPEPALRIAIAGHQASGTFADDVRIPRDAHDHFARILAESGWLQAPVDYDSVVGGAAHASLGGATWRP